MPRHEQGTRTRVGSRVGSPGITWSDDRLVRACLDGNEQAWAALIEKYKNLIYSMPLKYGASQSDAADIFQSVCLKLFAELPRLRQSAALRGWLLTVTTHESFHTHKKQRRRGEQALTEFEETQLGTDPRATPVIEEVEREQVLREAVRGLSAALPGDRPAAVLRGAAGVVSRSGRAARSGDRLDRLHPRPVPEESPAGARKGGVLVAANWNTNGWTGSSSSWRVARPPRPA